MNAAVPDSLVADYEPLIEGLKLPDPDDRHVLAAAIKCHATMIATWNLADFPAVSLGPWHLKAKSPDNFLPEQIGIDDRRVWACVQQIADSRHNPPETTEDVLDALDLNALTGLDGAVPSQVMRMLLMSTHLDEAGVLGRPCVITIGETGFRPVPG